MKKTFVVASLLAVALAIAPVTSAFARGRHDGGNHRGGLVWGLANAVVATAVAVITLPIAIAAAVAQAPRYCSQGPTFAGTLARTTRRLPLRAITEPLARPRTIPRRRLRNTTDRRRLPRITLHPPQPITRRPRPGCTRHGRPRPITVLRPQRPTMLRARLTTPLVRPTMVHPPATTGRRRIITHVRRTSNAAILDATSDRRSLQPDYSPG